LGAGTEVAHREVSPVRLADLRRRVRRAGRKPRKREDVMIQWCKEKAARACAFALMGLVLGSRA
jgi:hypothetical protein